MTVHMVLGVEDPQYIEAFLDYLRSSEYNRRIQVTSFSRPDAFKAYWSRRTEHESRADFAALEPAFMMECEEGPEETKTQPWICLSSMNNNQADIPEIPGDIPVLSKFRPLPELMEELLEFGRVRELGPRWPMAAALPAVPVIGVYSAAGGSGKTTVALHLAKQLASEGARVFYLNLEIFGMPVEPQVKRRDAASAAGLADLLYELEAMAEQGNLSHEPVSRFAVRHPLIKADTFERVANLRELLEMERTATIRLIDYLAASGSYDVVVAACDSHPAGRSDGLIERCDRLVWLLLDDEEGLGKSAASLDYWSKGRNIGKEGDKAKVGGEERRSREMIRPAGILSKTLFVLNRYSGTTLCALPRPELIPAATLCEVPAWRQGDHAHILADAPAFQRDLLKLCRKLFTPEEMLVYNQGSTGL